MPALSGRTTLQSSSEMRDDHPGTDTTSVIGNPRRFPVPTASCRRVSIYSPEPSFTIAQTTRSRMYQGAVDRRFRVVISSGFRPGSPDASACFCVPLPRWLSGYRLLLTREASSQLAGGHQ